MQFLPLLFKDNLKGIKLTIRRGTDPQSKGHRPALRTFRKRKNADNIINKEMIEKKLFEFK